MMTAASCQYLLTIASERRLHWHSDDQEHAQPQHLSELKT